MRVFLYFTAIPASLAAVALAVRLWGVRPTQRQVALAAIGSAVLAVLFSSLSVVLSYDGNNHRLPLVLWVGASALFASVRPPIRTLFATIALIVWLCVLLGQHWTLIQSHDYTDNPQWIARVVRRRPLPGKTGRTRPEWHTWLTGLYHLE